MTTLDYRYDYEIDPETHRWPLRRRLGFGALALLPTLLLAVTLSLGVAHMLLGRSEALTDAAAIMLYTHVVAQTIVLLVFGHLLLDHEHLSRQAKLWWAAWFLFAAPVAIPAYWILHVVFEVPRAPHSPRRVRVIQSCYVGEPHAERTVREDDQVEIERRPVRAREPGWPSLGGPAHRHGGEPCM